MGVVRLSRALLVVTLLAAAVAIPPALEGCSSAAAPVGAGAPCEQVSDCQQGLVCIPQTNGTRVCSSNLSSIQRTEDSGAREGGGAVMMTPADAGKPPGDTGAAPQDTGAATQDTGAAQDTGGAADSSSG